MKKLSCVLVLALCLGALINITGLGCAIAGSEMAISNTTAAQISQAAWPKPAAVPTVEAIRRITVPTFIIIVLTTMCVYWAAKRNKTAADFYAAHSSITAWQNGLAIAGDYMSAASFLGIAGLVALYGYNGFMYSVGWLVAYVTVLLIVSGPCRNAGKYTMGDILASRSSCKPVRAVAAFSTVFVSTFYLVAQMVGAGMLMKLLLGIPFNWALIGVGGLMIVYVTFGGMIATTWVQIIKAGLLMTGMVILFLLVAAKAGFHPIQFFHDVAANMHIQEWAREQALKSAVAKPGIDYGQRFL